MKNKTLLSFPTQYFEQGYVTVYYNKESATEVGLELSTQPKTELSSQGMNAHHEQVSRSGQGVRRPSRGYRLGIGENKTGLRGRRNKHHKSNLNTVGSRHHQGLMVGRFMVQTVWQ